ncbi:MAG: fibronectin type III domain-containing protein [Planctomycetota bacterium]
MSTAYAIAKCPTRPQGFRLYNAAGRRLREMTPAARAADLLILALSPGDHDLSLTYVDAFGTESEPSPVTVTIADDGSPTPALAPPRDLRVRQTSGGGIALSWRAVNFANRYAVPNAYEVADRGGTGSVLATVNTEDRLGYFDTDLGPFPDGTTLDLAVRATDSQPDGQRSVWVQAPLIAADASAPPAPDLLTPLGSCACGCP